MKKLSSIVVATTMCALVHAASAQASTFTLESYAVTVDKQEPGLVLWEKDILADPFTFLTDLSNVGDSFTTKLFTVGTNETTLNRDDWMPSLISVNFSFSAPPPAFGGNAYGLTGAASWGKNFGYVVWDNPLLVAFGNTGLLGITLSNAMFGLPGSADIQAQFKLMRADTPVSTPEPGSLLLLGTGLVTVALGVRRRRAA